MIDMLYMPFRKWSDGGSIYIISDLHFEDKNCQLMDPKWVHPDTQIELINSVVKKFDTFICLGDVGNGSYLSKIHAKHKVLLLGNHDKKSAYKDYFDEIYAGPIFIAEKILLSHEPIIGLSWCLNIHGHDHCGTEVYPEDCQHINVAANVCNYTPINLGKLIKDGIVSNIPSIHRLTIDQAIMNKQTRNR